ncbi:hypothetical protein DB346_04330 [Verrucomicrobia bacterium LW23]|nr:hypothetical protein DB346_04330 [Verrucomicrobia bacterium LW23]
MLHSALSPVAGNSRRRRRSTYGFSLVEVALALGVLSTSMLGMLSLTVVGINSLREAVAQTAQTEILQQISTELQMVGFDNIDSHIAGKTYYFGSEAERLESQTAATRYKVTMDRQSAVFPNSTSGGSMDQSLTTVRILMTPVMGSGPTEGKTAIYVVFVPNSGSL